MMRKLSSRTRLNPVVMLVAAASAVTLTAFQQQPPAPPTSQQPSDISTTITGDNPGVAPRLAVPNFLALSNDAETAEAARTIGQVLWDDLNFEREFAMIPRDVTLTVPAASSVATIPFDRWRELNADGVIFGTVQKTNAGVHVEVRLINVRSRQTAFAMEYNGAVASRRRFAHLAADDIHRQRGLQGVAQTKLTFNSDRSGERLTGAVANRGVKEVMISDYDGENVQAVTNNRSLNIASVWSPDAQSIAYTSWRADRPPNIYVAHIYKGTSALLTDGKTQNMLPAWSPDGKQIAFASFRSGNSDIYVMNSDGSGVRQLTNNPADDTTPTWSPSGTRIAFTSSRTGTPQIWEMGVDGLGQNLVSHESQADRATWSLAPFNEIAFAAQTGPGWDIKIVDMTTRTVRQLTFGEGTNESPAFAPNGRHLAFTSTRAGREQIFTMSRDGKDLRQVTRGSNNRMANWSRGPAVKN